uniref:Uncharacterized protein n=1 Tax=viral metagenome TaxID=1070528 RepID=A0A6C0LE73_9ZZZZ
MPTKKKFRRNKKTLKNKINKYICRKTDICCEDDIDRNVVIENIFMLYREIAEFMYEKDEYLAHINNDLVKFIGYRIDLEKNNDNKGVRLWDKIDRKMYVNKKLDETKIRELLKEVPLYYLLAFLGTAYYKYKTTRDILENIEKEKAMKEGV